MFAPAQLAALLLGGDPDEGLDGTLSAGDRLAMLLERVDELSLAATTSAAASVPCWPALCAASTASRPS